MSFLFGDDEVKKLEKLLDMSKVKLVEAGKELIGAAGDEVDRLKITITIDVVRQPK